MHTTQDNSRQGAVRVKIYEDAKDPTLMLYKMQKWQFQHIYIL